MFEIYETIFVLKKTKQYCNNTADLFEKVLVSHHWEGGKINLSIKDKFKSSEFQIPTRKIKKFSGHISVAKS